MVRYDSYIFVSNTIVFDMVWWRCDLTARNKLILNNFEL